MTFDELIKRLSQDIDKNGGQEKYQKEVIATLKLLHKEYAPTIEMTAKEKGQFLSIAASSIKFINFYEQVLKQSTNIKLGIQASPELYKQLSENDLMQAWLHPETIKVVD